MNEVNEAGVTLCLGEEEVRADEFGSRIEDDALERRVLRNLSTWDRKEKTGQSQYPRTRFRVT